MVSVVVSPSTQLLLNLFESTPHVMICVKDVHSRYIAVNDAFVRRTSRKHPRELIGKRAAELFPPLLAVTYDAQDQALLRTGIAVRNQLEIITDRGGRPEWFLTTKVLHDRDLGCEPEIVVVSTQAQLAQRQSDAAFGLRAAIELTFSEQLGKLRVEDLANAAHMTVDQLERSMRKVLGTSPKQYLMAARLNRAATMVATTGTPISEVATQCGYYDQSQFTRYFKASMGMTPGEYRRTARMVTPSGR
jgi:AraC-like DNA-binding protein